MSDLLPNRLVTDSSTTRPECFGPGAVNYAMCPTGGFTSLLAYTSQLQMIKTEPIRCLLRGLYLEYSRRTWSTLPV